MLIYPNIGQFREIYSAYAKANLDSEIILIATHYETVERVRDNIRKQVVDVDRFEKEGSLKIFDSFKSYFTTDIYGTINLAKSMVKYAELANKTGVTVFADPGPFFLLNKATELLDYELELPSKFDIQVKGICCYHAADLDNNFSDPQKKQLINHHHRTITAS